LSEQGRAPRADKRYPVLFEPTLTGPREDHEGVTLNVSARGLGMKGATAYPVGTVLNLVLQAADGEPIRLQGTVMWSKEATGHMGVRLIAPDARYADFVNRAAAAARARELAGAVDPDDIMEDTGELTPPPERHEGLMADPTAPIDKPEEGEPPADEPAGPATLMFTQSKIVPTPLPEPAPPSEAPPVIEDDLPTPDSIPPDFPTIHAPMNGTLATETVMSPVGDWPPGLRMARFDDPLPLRLGVGAFLETRGFLDNLSRSGLRLTCRESYPPGTLLRIAVTLPEGELARVEGFVVWARAAEKSSDADLGIRIVRADEVFTRLIDETEARSI
jgi:hypothetical protein